MDDKERFPAEMYDSSDVKVEIASIGRRKVVVTFKATEADFNLVKFYLSLKDLTERIAGELGILEKAEGDH
jgi:hypothetical protein